VGCSNSFLSHELIAHDLHVYGVDIRPYLQKHPSLFFIRADIVNMPFRNNFDLVIAVSTIEHIGLGAYNDARARKDHSLSVISNGVNIFRQMLHPGLKWTVIPAHIQRPFFRYLTHTNNSYSLILLA
jgi:hypothetical protein